MPRLKDSKNQMSAYVILGFEFFVEQKETMKCTHLGQNCYRGLCQT